MTGVAICSLVEKIETKLKGVDVKRHLIEVPNFGKNLLSRIYCRARNPNLDHASPRTRLAPTLRTSQQPKTRTNGRPSPSLRQVVALVLFLISGSCSRGTPVAGASPKQFTIRFSGRYVTKTLTRRSRDVDGAFGATRSEKTWSGRGASGY